MWLAVAMQSINNIGTEKSYTRVIALKLLEFDKQSKLVYYRNY